MKQFFLIFFIGTFWLRPAYCQMDFDTSGLIEHNPQLYAIAVSQNDRIIFEKYFNGKTNRDLFHNQSLTKSVVSLLIGIAIDKGYISTVDEKIVKYFPELNEDPDKRKQAITIREIMNQASGLWHEDLTNLAQFMNLPNPSSYVLKQPLVSDPGKVFHYNNAASHLLSVILTKATGMNTLDFAMKYLFGPLDIKRVRWDKMADGYYDGSGLLSVQLPIVDMNRIGSILLHKGYFGKRSVVSEKWIGQIIQPSIFYNTPWGFNGSTYALCWYHYKYWGLQVTYGLGWGGQFIFIIPGKNAIISVNESIDDRTAIKASNLFLDKIFPLINQQLK